MRIVPFRPEHGVAIGEHLAEGVVIPPEAMRELEGYSAIMDSGEVVCCAGVARWEELPHIGTAWAFVNRNISGPAFVAVTRATLAMLDTRLERRIEAKCRADWTKARRWLEALGFRYEGPVWKYAPDGSDFAQYARVK